MMKIKKKLHEVNKILEELCKANNVGMISHKTLILKGILTEVDYI